MEPTILETGIFKDQKVMIRIDGATIHGLVRGADFEKEMVDVLVSVPAILVETEKPAFLKKIMD